MRATIPIVIIFLTILLSSFPQATDAFGECSEYGFMAYVSGSYCKCLSGYVMGSFLGRPYCISADQACTDEYGYGATSDYLTNKCKCKYGYIFSLDFLGRTKCIDTNQYCRDKFGINSRYNTLINNCECSYGYILQKNMLGDYKCEDVDSVCHDRLGYNSKYNSTTDKCECSSGYELTVKQLSGLECKSCLNKYGVHSSYNYLLKECECNSGYTLNEDNQCVKKQNNIYFKLIELDVNNKEAIIKSEYDNKYYSIKYRSGCHDSSFSRYLSKQIVINLGTDLFVDRGDKIVLQDDDEVCEISNFEKVDSDFSLFDNDIVLKNSNKSAAGYNLSATLYNYSLASKLKGKILLQVESHGEAWYVNPKDNKRYYMASGSEAYTVMRTFGVGISNKDLDKIKSNKIIAKKSSGKIFLQVEAKGEAYYVDFNGDSHYLKDGSAAYEVMRSFGLGITNNELNKIPEGKL